MAPRRSRRAPRARRDATRSIEAQVVRRKTFAMGPESLEGALFDLEVLDHDFFLFVHDETGTEAVVYRAGDGYGLMERVPAPDAVARVEIPLEIGPPPATHGLEDALAILDASGRPFEFFVDADTRQGLVVYRRHDGNYGLIVPVGEISP